MKKVSRAQFLRLSAAALATAVLPSRKGSGAAQSAAIVRRRRPNILLLLTDQERSWSDLPAGLELPQRQSLAARGLSFDQYHANAVACAPSRSVIYTGQHIQRTAVFDNPGKTPGRKDLDPQATPTLGTMLQQNGYRTAYIGKWHMSVLPRGADMDHAGALRPFGFEQFVPALQSGDTMDSGLEGLHDDPAIAAGVERWFAANARIKGEDRPWFLAVNLINPHDIQYLDATGKQRSEVHPHFAAEMSSVPDRAPYTDDLGFALPPSFPGPPVRTIAAHRAYVEDARFFYGDLPLSDTAAWLRYQNYYFNCLRDVDRDIGTVLAALERSGAMGETIIIFSSDHGEMGGAQGLRLKGPFIYKENFRVPFVMVHPDLRNPASQTHALASAVDLAPTLLSAIGLDERARADRYPALKGRDLLPLLTAPGGTVRDALLFNSSIVHCCNPIKKGETIARLYAAQPGQKPPPRRFPEDFVQVDDRTFLRAVFDGRYKFGRYFAPSQHHLPADWDMLTRYDDLELYDTRTDPHERNNIAGPAQRELLLRLNARLNSLLVDEAGGDDGSYLPGDPAQWRLG